jgi:hypothetical protein
MGRTITSCSRITSGLRNFSVVLALPRQRKWGICSIGSAGRGASLAQCRALRAVAALKESAATHSQRTFGARASFEFPLVVSRSAMGADFAPAPSDLYPGIRGHAKVICRDWLCIGARTVRCACRRFAGCARMYAPIRRCCSPCLLRRCIWYGHLAGRAAILSRAAIPKCAAILRRAAAPGAEVRSLGAVWGHRPAPPGKKVNGRRAEKSDCPSPASRVTGQQRLPNDFGQWASVANDSSGLGFFVQSRRQGHHFPTASGRVPNFDGWKQRQHQCKALKVT